MTQEKNVQCPKCGATEAICVDVIHAIFTPDDVEEFFWMDVPISLLLCANCDHKWREGMTIEGWTYRGDDLREAFGWEN